MFKEEMKNIGKRIFVLDPVHKIQWEAEVLDVKMSWGRVKWKVKPLKGVGECWIEATVKSKK